MSGQLFQGAKGGLRRCWIRVGREVGVAEISLFNRQGKAIRRWEEMALAQYLQYLGAARANIDLLILAPESLSAGREN